VKPPRSRAAAFENGLEIDPSIIDGTPGQCPGRPGIRLRLMGKLEQVDVRNRQATPRAFSSEVDTGSREENASKQKIRAEF
jgi:hypothetical protein